uniref:TNase-like domain-containing protein n=1 Tax=Strongyloides stercoralis TaxID=6248 RepID=A0A0K0E5S5_STRER
MNFKIIILLLSLCTIFTSAFFFEKKIKKIFKKDKKEKKITIIVKGRVLCDGKPLKNIKMKLDKFIEKQRDEKLATGKTKKNGDFYLVGKMKGFTGYNVRVKLWHKCYNRKFFEKFCYYKYIPDLPFGKMDTTKRGEYIIYNLKDVKLSKKGRSGERDCFKF